MNCACIKWQWQVAHCKPHTTKQTIEPKIACSFHDSGFEVNDISIETQYDQNLYVNLLNYTLAFYECHNLPLPIYSKL